MARYNGDFTKGVIIDNTLIRDIYVFLCCQIQILINILIVEILTSFWGTFLSGSLLSAIGGAFLFKYKLRKAKNDSVMDDLETKKELMRYIDVLSIKITELYQQGMIRQEVSAELEQNSRIFKKSEAVHLQQIKVLEKELLIFKTRCSQCQFGISLK
jgi:hypothetical protein